MNTTNSGPSQPPVIQKDWNPFREHEDDAFFDSLFRGRVKSGKSNPTVSSLFTQVVPDLLMSRKFATQNMVAASERIAPPKSLEEEKGKQE